MGHLVGHIKIFCIVSCPVQMNSAAVLWRIFYPHVNPVRFQREILRKGKEGCQIQALLQGRREKDQIHAVHVKEQRCVLG